MFLIEEKMYDESKFNIPSKNIWEYLGRRWKIEEAVNNLHFLINNSRKCETFT